MISSKSETKISLQLTRNISTWYHEKAGDQRLVDNMCQSDAMQCEIYECKNNVYLCYVSVKIPCSMKVSVSVSSSDWRGRHSLCSYRQLFTPPGLLGSPASLLAHSSNSWLPSSPVQQMWWYDPELVSWPWGGLAVGHCTEPHTHMQICSVLNLGF